MASIIPEPSYTFLNYFGRKPVLFGSEIIRIGKKLLDAAFPCFGVVFIDVILKSSLNIIADDMLLFNACVLPTLF